MRLKSVFYIQAASSLRFWLSKCIVHVITRIVYQNVSKEKPRRMIQSLWDVFFIWVMWLWVATSRCYGAQYFGAQKTIIHRQKKLSGKKNRPFSLPISFSFAGEFFFIIVGNPPIWVLHSRTIKDYKKIFIRALNT